MENEVLLSYYTNLIYEASVMRDIEHERADSIHYGVVGSEDVDESEGILIVRSVFF